MRVAIATACGNKKRSGTWPAYLLYESTRIKALYNRRDDFPFYILSAKYGLIECHTEIACYDQVMSQERASELAPLVGTIMRQFDAWIFFKAGAHYNYSLCMRKAGELGGTLLVSVGFGFMGELHEFLRVAELIRDEKPIPPDIRSLELHGFAHY